MVNLEIELKRDFIEVEPLEFYRDIFKFGELDVKNAFTKNKFIGIACEFCNVKKSNGKDLVKRYSITDDLDIIKDLLLSDNFVIISPISYIGKSRKTENARLMYAFAIEIDNLLSIDNDQRGYKDLLFQMKNKVLPTPNYFVASGNGLHLYYVFDKPLVLYPNVIKSLINYKKAATPFFWNRYVTTSYKKSDIQFESPFQGFRLAGGITKNGDRTKVFKVKNEPTTVQELNAVLCSDKKNYIEEVYKSNISLQDAKEKYPEWYKNRVVDKKPKGTWHCKIDLYNWWLREIKEKKGVGHRYYCIMLLCIYAIKCDVSYEQLEKDCFSLLENFDSISDSDNNRFTEKDIVDALQIYEDKGFITYPINSISLLSGIEIKKNKRNYRKREVHIKTLNVMRKFRRDELGEDEYKNNGRKPKKDIVKEWQYAHPNGKKIECHRDTGLSRMTIDKWWENDKKA